MNHPIDSRLLYSPDPFSWSEIVGYDVSRDDKLDVLPAIEVNCILTIDQRTE
jgi:hypothetical protein